MSRVFEVVEISSETLEETTVRLLKSLAYEKI